MNDHAGHVVDEGAYLPTPEEIEAECRKIREERERLNVIHWRESSTETGPAIRTYRESGRRGVRFAFQRVK